MALCNIHRHPIPTADFASSVQLSLSCFIFERFFRGPVWSLRVIKGWGLGTASINATLNPGNGGLKSLFVSVIRFYFIFAGRGSRIYLSLETEREECGTLVVPVTTNRHPPQNTS
jgi:hypothetical protein